MMPRFVASDEIRIEVDLRWRDLDFLGHLNQAVYHELLEEGRGALFEQLGVLDEGFFFVLARVELDHRLEVRRDHGPVTLAQRVEAVGRSSVTSPTRSCATTATSPPRAARCSSRGTATRAARGRSRTPSAPRSLEPSAAISAGVRSWRVPGVKHGPICRSSVICPPSPIDSPTSSRP